VGASVTVVVAVTVTVVVVSLVVVWGQTYVRVMSMPEIIAGPVQRAGRLEHSSRATIAGAQPWLMGALYWMISLVAAALTRQYICKGKRSYHELDRPVE
jgi:hypothetical protein